VLAQTDVPAPITGNLGAIVLIGRSGRAFVLNSREEMRPDPFVESDRASARERVGQHAEGRGRRGGCSGRGCARMLSAMPFCLG
jgi:hypothetical protein